MGFGIYVHWPFCRSKCPYCDFVSIPAKKFDCDAWAKAYEKSLKFYAEETAGKTVTSIFFGGGTPSLMTFELVSFVIKTIRNLWVVSDDVEISAEVNPCSINREKMLLFRQTGINRLSVGAQSFNNNSLKFLGRMHSAGQALAVIKDAKEIFPIVSADFIYALPNQSLQDWKNELDFILSSGLNLKHLSLYQLTIEEGSFFYRKGIRPAEEDLAADMFELTDRMTYQAGLERYEVSNHAVKGYECRHNLLYWNGGEWIGTGPAAHGRYTSEKGVKATSQEKNVSEWLLNQTNEQIILTPKETAVELILMGLRIRDGIDRNTFFTRTGMQPEDFMDSGTLNDYQTDGFLICDKKGIRATTEGTMILDALCRTLLK